MVYLSISTKNCSDECFFSSLKRIKAVSTIVTACLRSQIHQTRSNALFILNIENEQFQSLDYFEKPTEHTRLKYLTHSSLIYSYVFTIIQYKRWKLYIKKIEYFKDF